MTDDEISALIDPITDNPDVPAVIRLAIATSMQAHILGGTPYEMFAKNLAAYQEILDEIYATAKASMN